MNDFLQEYNPPAGPMGWLGIEAERASLRVANSQALVLGFEDVEKQVLEDIAYLDNLNLALQGNDERFLWHWEKWLYERGKLPFSMIPCYFQETGDCVSFGVKSVLERRTIAEIACWGQEEVWHEVFAPWIYATSRNQVLGGMSGAGSTGAAGATAVNKYGTLFADDEGVPAYSGSIADSWGGRRNAGDLEDSPYGKYASIARNNKVQIVRLLNVEQVRLMLKAYRTVTIASNWGFARDVRNGVHYFKPSGSWGHQMSWTAWSDKYEAAYRQNSWGANAHGAPLNGETPGGAWNVKDDIASEIGGRGIEAYAYWGFQGEPSNPDIGIL